MRTCLIAGGMECIFPENISEDTYIIAADSGYDRCVAANIVPDLVIGDMDSIKGVIPSDIKTVKAPAEKDDTDVMLAVRTAFDMGCDDIILTGVTGGRAGHTMAALGTLEYISVNGGRGVILCKEGKFFLQETGKTVYKNDSDYRYISVFSLTDSAEVSMRGLKYGGENMTVTRDFPIGVSNEFTGRTAEIEVYKGKILVILEK